jgi:hypothetical protein
MSSGIVYVLALLGYNSIGGEITTHKEMSWHLSQSECNEVMWQEKTRGRKPRFNQQYVCMRVVDHEKRAAAEHERYDHDYPRRHGSNRLIIEW